MVIKLVFGGLLAKFIRDFSEYQVNEKGSPSSTFLPENTDGNPLAISPKLHTVHIGSPLV
jgi:hypothetical protein